MKSHHLVKERVFSWVDPRVIAVILLILTGCVVAIKLRDERAQSVSLPSGVETEPAGRSNRLDGSNQFQPRIKKSARSLLPPQDQVTANRMRDLREAGDFASIHGELESLSEEDRLTDVADLLKEWCGKAELELVQWCLIAAAGKEGTLELELAAEALSNPSEVMREVAASLLEEASGVRFAHPDEARAWLSGLSANPKKIQEIKDE